jgi:hypothetical protein
MQSRSFTHGDWIRALSIASAIALQSCTTYHDIEKGEQAGTYLVCQTTNLLIFSRSKIVEYQLDRTSGKLVANRELTGKPSKK